MEPQTWEPLEIESLVGRVAELRAEGWRLVQIGATAMGQVLELNYSFDRQGTLLNLRLTVPGTGARVPSISSVYWCAFIYENEIHDLFGLVVEGMAMDFGGHFYQTRVRFPFACTVPDDGRMTVNPAPPEP
jgi:ech hydrogenase subunit D